jgi:hypothetical protein
MAHPRKHSRLITVSGQQYRWHVDLDDDTADEKLLSVYPAEDPNGARLAMTLCNPTIAPSLVRRLILVGTRLGYAPHDRAKSLIIPAGHVSEILRDYPRVILHSGIEYTWTPESRGGLHVKVRRSDFPQGQLLATFTSLKPHHLSEPFVSRVIDAALHEGWNPTAPGLDCYWLDAAACSHIIETLSS